MKKNQYYKLTTIIFIALTSSACASIQGKKPPTEIKVKIVPAEVVTVTQCTANHGYLQGAAAKVVNKHCVQSGEETYLDAYRSGLTDTFAKNNQYLLKADEIRRNSQQQLEQNNTRIKNKKLQTLTNNMINRILILTAKQSRIESYLLKLNPLQAKAIQAASVVK